MSQKNMILSRLKTHSITPLEALKKFGVFRLASRIKELRKEGYKIKTSIIEKYGKRFAQYSLKK